MAKWYDDYLKSIHWKRTRLRKLLASELSNEFNAVRCQDSRCRMWFPLGFIEVHHKTYARVGRERLSDLETLCFACHEYRHGHPRPYWWLELKRQDAQLVTKHEVYKLKGIRHVRSVVLDCLEIHARRFMEISSSYR